MWYYLSSPKMTVAVQVDRDGIIRDTPPIVAKFRGQPINNLREWLGFTVIKPKHKEDEVWEKVVVDGE